MSKGLPAALQLKSFPKQGNMKIQTVVLEPQLAQNNFVRYVLERRAILGSDSIFTFSLITTADAAGLQPTLPINTGIACLIKNCTLRLGNVIISRTEDWAYYDTVARCFQSPEARTLKGSVINGTLDTMRPSTKTDGCFSLQNAIYSTDAVSGVPHQLDLSQNPIFSIKLSELFPALKGMQIPLGHLEENMVVEFELNQQLAGTQGILARMNDATKDDAFYVVTPNYGEMTMLADYLSFADSTHEEIDDLVNGGKGLVMPFHEIVTIRGQVPAVAEIADNGTIVDQPIPQELGLAGRTVKSVVVVDTSALTEGAAKAVVKDSLNGVYQLQGLPVQGETQVKVNDLNVYPRPMTSVTNHITETESVFRSPLGVTRAEYDLGSSVIFEPGKAAEANNLLDKDVSFNAAAMGILSGHRHVEGVPLITDPVTGRGTRILDKPIRYERTLKRSGIDFQDVFNSRYFCAVEKAFAIKDGQVSVMV